MIGLRKSRNIKRLRDIITVHFLIFILFARCSILWFFFYNTKIKMMNLDPVQLFVFNVSVMLPFFKVQNYSEE